MEHDKLVGKIQSWDLRESAEDAVRDRYWNESASSYVPPSREEISKPDSKETIILLMKPSGEQSGLYRDLEAILSPHYKIDSVETSRDVFSRLKEGKTDYDLVIVPPDYEGYMCANIITSALNISGSRIIVYGPSANQKQAGDAMAARDAGKLRTLLKNALLN